MTPEKILRNLENGYFMTHQEQDETAKYIRELQQAVLDEREACAKLCLEPIYYGQVQNNRSTVGGNKYVRDKTAQECAYLIRARSEK